MQGLKISIIGAGNVGTHLAKTLHKNGHHIHQIYSRNLSNAQRICDKVNAIALNSLSDLNPNIDLILLCVSDAALDEVVCQLKFQKTLIAHTAGSIPLSALSQFENHGVVYPLQTFSKESELNIENIPFCIEANTEGNRDLLLKLAKSISNTVYELNSEQRVQCHLAAVFANNFTNHMFVVAEKILKKNNLPFSLLRPLIIETANKIQNINPGSAQTGPAVRNDKNTINKHLELLHSPDLEKIYSFVSQSIWDIKNKNNQDE